MKFLDSLVGGIIFARIEGLRSTDGDEYCLHAFDDNGIWVEHNELSEFFLRSARSKIAPQSVVIFVPWCRIIWMCGIDGNLPSISEGLLD